MKQIGRIGLAMLLISAASLAAEQTWTGLISSSMCHAEKGSMGNDCILNCIKGGSKYVFVAKGKSYDVQNQDFSDLEKHAGHTVKLTGGLGSDGHSITVNRIEMVSAS